MISAAVLALLFCVSATQAGVSYVRWGRTTCPTGNIKLYNGYMIGQQYNGIGNGANFLCAPDKPKIGKAQAGYQGAAGWSGTIAGVLIRRDPALSFMFSTENLNGADLDKQNMLCALCHVPDSTDKFVIPGRDDCYDSGYALQYKGFLMSESNYAGRMSHEYICLDEAPEAGGVSSGGGVSGIYPVQLQCGSLPCSVYPDAMEVPCAVCAY